MAMTEQDLKKQVFGVLEDYGFFQKAKFHEWDSEYRDRFFLDFLEIVKRYAGVLRTNKPLDN
jgi:hypothetical protein